MKLLGSLLFIGAMGAYAGPIVWTLNGVQFSDGGTATGSFTFDADAGTACGSTSPCGVFTSVNIITTTGSSRTGATYTFVCGQDVAGCNGVSPDSTEVLFLTSSAANQTGLPALALFFTGVGGFPPAGLTDAGGVIDISNSSTSVGVGQEASCSNGACSTPAGSSRVTVAGTVVASTPEPSSAVLLGSVLATLSLARLRRVWSSR